MRPNFISATLINTVAGQTGFCRAHALVFVGLGQQHAQRNHGCISGGLSISTLRRGSNDGKARFFRHFVMEQATAHNFKRKYQKAGAQNSAQNLIPLNVNHEKASPLKKLKSSRKLVVSQSPCNNYKKPRQFAAPP